MTVAEILIVSARPEDAEAFLQPLASENETIFDIPAYRVAIDDQLVLLCYSLTVATALDPELMAHLRPHLSAILVLGNTAEEPLSDAAQWDVDAMIAENPDTPAVVAVQIDTSREFNETIHEKQFSLGNRRRMMFWTPGDKAAIGRIFQALLVEQPEPPVTTAVTPPA